MESSSESIVLSEIHTGSETNTEHDTETEKYTTKKAETIIKQPSSIKMIRIKLFVFFDDMHSSKAALFTSVFIMLVIIMSTITFCLESLSKYEGRPIWFKLETFAIVVFTIEYVCRIQGCCFYDYGGPGLKKFLMNFLNTIDLLSILPYYIEFAVDGGASSMAIVRIIRLARIFRVFKISKYSQSFQIIGLTMKKSKQGFNLLIFLSSLSIIVFSSVIYFCELSGQTLDKERNVWVRDIDGSDSPFQSIPHSFWWSVVTLSTVGYGDAYPVTNIGKLFAGLFSVLSIIILSFPITIFTMNMAWSYEEILLRKEQEVKEKEEKKRKVQNSENSYSGTPSDNYSHHENAGAVNTKKIPNLGGAKFFINGLNDLCENLKDSQARMERLEKLISLKKKRKITRNLN
ncbi:voltage-gated potassium channel [Anaeramoeba flamelloides]|uniref:Voltage-gated potassium channel n=1 Tax=Anaeramoeba flamelloides TaxID=1746091 RepID=A0AAV7YZ92_9EUKA|nr:voltage-gated potassium channel [Anaeramoeba flamelloides]